MSKKDQTTSSLRENILLNIDSFLLKEKFIVSSEIISKGILEIINSISDYYEEGVHLYPEIVITNDIDKLESTIPSRQFVIKNAELSVDGFKDAIKLCAPLAIDGWIIFIEVSNETSMRFGLITSEISETSLSLYKQTIEDQDPVKGVNLAYLRNLGKKTVELIGYKKNLIVSLTLDDYESVLNNEIRQLSKAISNNCLEEFKDKIATYFEKIISNAVKEGHGNLIGVVKDDKATIDQLRTNLKDGIYLEKPIDIQQLVINIAQNKDEESSIVLRQYASILTSMLNHDGITILTDRALILGYHLFVVSDSSQSVVGGARTRAYNAMCRLGLIASFYKSQDGNVKYFENEK